MLRYLFALAMLLHGLIHWMGFAKAFGYGKGTPIAKEISTTAGAFWLLAAFLFLAAVLLFLFKKEGWIAAAVVAVILSQILIVTVWKDARFGTLANVVILLVAIAAWGSQHFESTFRKDVLLHLQQSANKKMDLLTEADLQSLPLPVQKYLRYCGVVNKPKIKNMRVVFDGEMREKGKDWFTFSSTQYNFFGEPARLFFMKARMFGMVVPGYHDYQHATAKMNIKLFGLFPVVQASGKKMNQAETVTLFNDMCLMAPAALIDKRIVWQQVDSLTAKAIFTNGAINIAAMLYFNAAGQLINFTSDDRYAIAEMKQYRFSTPVKDYRQLNGQNIFTYGETTWQYPDGAFVYGKFYLKSIEYNVPAFK